MKRFHRLRTRWMGARDPLAKPCPCGKVCYTKPEAVIEARNLARKYKRPFSAAKCRGVYGKYGYRINVGWAYHIYLDE